MKSDSRHSLKHSASGDPESFRNREETMKKATNFDIVVAKGYLVIEEDEAPWK